MKGLKVIFLFCTILFTTLSSFIWANDKEKKSPYKISKVLKISIDSSINPATLNYLESGVHKAQSLNVDAILITLDTPGGLVSTTKDILTLMGKSIIPIIVWITPEGASATSAGALLSSASHILLMSPGTNIGAATPITITGEGNLPAKEQKKESPTSIEKEIFKKLKKQSSSSTKASEQKAINDLVALVKSLSEARGRNGEKFSEMITKASSFTATEASKNGLIDFIIETPSSLWSKIDGKTLLVQGQSFKMSVPSSPQIIKHEMDMGQLILDILANPSLSYILFLIGAALLYLEFQAPGGMIAGSIGAVFLIFAGIGFQVLPLNFGALGLIVLSFVLFVLEIYITSYGILSLGGLTALLFGSLFLFRSEDSYLHFQENIVYSTVAAIALFLFFLTTYLIKDLRKQKKLNQGHKNYDHHHLIGKMASIESILEENGHYLVKTQGELWKAKSENPHLKIKDKVKILDIDSSSLRLKVTLLQEKENTLE